MISCRAQTRLLANILFQVTVLPDNMRESEHDDQHQRLPSQLLHHLLQPQPLLPLMTQESLPLFPLKEKIFVEILLTASIHEVSEYWVMVIKAKQSYQVKSIKYQLCPMTIGPDCLCLYTVKYKKDGLTIDCKSSFF